MMEALEDRLCHIFGEFILDIHSVLRERCEKINVRHKSQDGAGSQLTAPSQSIPCTKPADKWISIDDDNRVTGSGAQENRVRDMQQPNGSSHLNQGCAQEILEVSSSKSGETAITLDHTEANTVASARESEQAERQLTLKPRRQDGLYLLLLALLLYLDCDSQRCSWPGTQMLTGLSKLKGTVQGGGRYGIG